MLFSPGGSKNVPYLSLFRSQANKAVGLTLSQIIAVSLKMYQ